MFNPRVFVHRNGSPFIFTSYVARDFASLGFDDDLPND